MRLKIHLMWKALRARKAEIPREYMIALDALISVSLLTNLLSLIQ